MLLVIIYNFLVHHSLGCVIQGYDSGVCQAAQDIQDRMPFCGPAVQYTACVPKDLPWNTTTVSVSGDTQTGAVEKKDRWLNEQYNAFIRRRIAVEKEDIVPDDPSTCNLRVSCLLNYP
jgi:hypothetical protein